MNVNGSPVVSQCQANGGGASQCRANGCQLCVRGFVMACHRVASLCHRFVIGLPQGWQRRATFISNLGHISHNGFPHDCQCCCHTFAHVGVCHKFANLSHMLVIGVAHVCQMFVKCFPIICHICPNGFPQVCFSFATYLLMVLSMVWFNIGMSMISQWLVCG